MCMMWRKTGHCMLPLGKETKMTYVQPQDRILVAARPIMEISPSRKKEIHEPWDEEDGCLYGNPSKR